MEKETTSATVFTIELTDNQSLDNQDLAFATLFLEAVESAFSLLGPRSKQILLNYVFRRLEAGHGPLVVDVAAFAEAIEDVFGPAANLIEMRIMQFLHEKVPSFRYIHVKGELSFLNYVETFRSFM